MQLYKAMKSFIRRPKSLCNGPLPLLSSAFITKENCWKNGKSNFELKPRNTYRFQQLRVHNGTSSCFNPDQHPSTFMSKVDIKGESSKVFRSDRIKASISQSVCFLKMTSRRQQKTRI